MESFRGARNELWEHSFLMYHELESPGHHLCQSEAGYIRYNRADLPFPLADGPAAGSGA